MTIDISKGVYLTTKEIKDYAKKHNLDATDVWKRVIQKFVDLGVTEYEGREGASEDYSLDWPCFRLVGVRDDNTTYHNDPYTYFGDDPTPISIYQLFASEATEEYTPFQLEVGKVYKSGNEYVKIVYKEEGLKYFSYVGLYCNAIGDVYAYVGLFNVDGFPDNCNNVRLRDNLEPLPTEHPNVTKIKELEEQINKLKEDMK